MIRLACIKYREVLLTVACLLATGLPAAFAQLNGPEQDCNSAIPLCQSVYVQDTSYQGWGQVEDFNEENSCLINGENNSVWYVFTVVSPGTLEFLIKPEPSPLSRDYDFALFNITNRSCADIYNDSTLQVRCNYSSQAPIDSTGLLAGAVNNTEGSGGPPFLAPLTVTAGETFVLVVDKFSSDPIGYTLDFRRSTAQIVDNEPPRITAIDTMECDNTSVLNITFSEPILCSSLAPDGSDFQITGPSAVTIASAASPDCASGSFTLNATLTLSAPILTGGAYNLNFKTGTDGNTVRDNCGNLADAPGTIPFNVPNLVTANFDYSKSTSCLADTVQFTNESQGNFTSVLWDYGDSSPTSTANDPLHIYDSIGTYTVTLTVSSAECSDAFSRDVVANLNYEAAVGSNPAEPCVGQPLVLSDTAQLAATTYFWTVVYNGDTAGLSALANPTFTFPAGGTYTATLVINDNVLGCADTASADILVHAASVAGFDANDPVCEDTEINFTDISSGSPQSWLWRFTANDSSTLQNPTFEYTSTGTFPVYLAVIDSFCGGDTTTVNVNVRPLPTFYLGDDEILCRSEEITLRAYPGADSYLWVTGETTETIEYDSIPSKVWATAELNGCFYTDTLQIFEQTEDCSFAVVPSGFSPNTDGTNDLLRVLTKRVSSYELIIYNRWGQEVYRGTDADQGWDGTFKDDPQDIGVFAFVLNWRNLNGVPFVETGNITLVR